MNQCQAFFREQLCIGIGQVMVHHEGCFLTGIEQVWRQQYVEFRDEGCDTLQCKTADLYPAPSQVCQRSLFAAQFT